MNALNSRHSSLHHVKLQPSLFMEFGIKFHYQYVLFLRDDPLTWKAQSNLIVGIASGSMEFLLFPIIEAFSVELGPLI